MSWPVRIATLKKGGFSLARFMAAQADGFWYDFGLIGTLSQDTSGATPVAAFGDVIGRVVDRRTGANSPRNATQATTSLKPKYQSTGAAFDGADDNLLTNYTAGSGDMFFASRLTVPASVPVAQFPFGARDTTPNTNCYLVVKANGIVGAGIGNQNESTITDLTLVDRRGSTIVVGLSLGTTVRLFINSALVYEGAPSGNASTTVAWRIGARNVNGSGASFFAGSVKSLVTGRQAIDLATFKKIAATI